MEGERKHSSHSLYNRLHLTIMHRTVYIRHSFSPEQLYARLVLGISLLFHLHTLNTVGGKPRPSKPTRPFFATVISFSFFYLFFIEFL